LNRIDRKFKDLRRLKQKAFIAFITAGFPDLKTTEKLVLEFDRIGVDIIELGVPFTDPMADGPVIQYASQESLKKGTRLIDILNLVKKIRKRTTIPLCLMTYYNPIFCFKEERFIKKSKEVGLDGVIIPDLPVEEAGAFIKIANRYNIDVICFISPTTSVKRIKYIAGIARGFIYYVSLTGVTGARRGLAADLVQNLKIIKKITNKPLCAGFGISSASQVQSIQGICDGVIIGSAIVKKIKDNIGKPDLVQKVGRFVRKLKR
jgi:tryptophan synthase alpha chain